MAVPRRLLPASGLLAALTRLTVGASAFTVLVFVLGRLGALLPAVLFGTTLAAAAVGLVGLPSVVRGAALPRGIGRFAGALAVVTIVALVVDVVAASAPPTSADALVYHVAFPHRWLELHRLDDAFWNYASFYPLGIETLFAQAMAVVGVGGQGSAMAAGSAASALHGLFALLAATAVFGLGRELSDGDAAGGILAAALFALQGLVTWDSASTFIDMGLVFYVAVAAWHAVVFARKPRGSSAAWVGVASGAAAGAKYIGPLAVVFLLGATAAVAVRVRAWAAIGWMAVAAVAAGGWWFIRNAVVTGNPVYPLLFGGKWWTAYDEQWLAGSAKYTYPGTHTNPLRILILPLDLLVHGSRFDRGQYASTLVLVLGPLAPLVDRRRAIVATLLPTLGFVFVWWYWTPQVRYLLPALAVLAAIGGAAFAPVLRSRGRARTVAVAVATLGVVAWLVPSAALTRQLLPVTMGAESRAAHVQRLTGTYDALRAIRRAVGPARIGFAPSYRFVYWYPGNAITVDLPEFEYHLPPAVFRARLATTGVHDVVFWGSVHQLQAIAGCSRLVGRFPGRYVTSRTRATSEPLVFSVYSVARC